MRATFVKIVGSTTALLVLGSFCVRGVRGQQTGKSSNSPTVTTNWVGYLVAGQNDTVDHIVPNPFPTIVGQVEIGLRSDGVVIWRQASKTK